MSMKKRKEPAVIYSQEKIAEGIYSLWIKTSFAGEARPGQFLGVYINNDAKLLARPISICDVNKEEGLLRMVYRTAGEGTKELASYEPGTEIQVLGVLGNGYESALNTDDLNKALGDKKVIVIGGGIGIPPMLLTAKALDKEPEIVLGYSNGDLFLEDEFEDVGNLHIATVDGSVGTKGTVIDAIKEDEIQGDVIFACGPMPMLKAIKQYAKENGMKAYISLEERMACGIGACLGCVCRTVNKDHHTHVNNTRICVEGPIFDAEDVDI